MTNFYFIITAVFLSYFLAQTSKFLTHKNLNFKKFFFGTGGMPSAHTSAIVSLPIAIFLTEGLTTILALSLVLVALVIRDAIGVRYAVGENAEILKKHFKKEKVVISKGHTIKDVLVGAFVGIFITLVVYLIW